MCLTVRMCAVFLQPELPRSALTTYDGIRSSRDLHWCPVQYRVFGTLTLTLVRTVVNTRTKQYYTTLGSRYDWYSRLGQCGRTPTRISILWRNSIHSTQLGNLRWNAECQATERGRGIIIHYLVFHCATTRLSRSIFQIALTLRQSPSPISILVKAILSVGKNSHNRRQSMPLLGPLVGGPII